MLDPALSSDSRVSSDFKTLVGSTVDVKCWSIVKPTHLYLFSLFVEESSMDVAHLTNCKILAKLVL